MPRKRKQTQDTKRRRLAARRRQETPEQRALRLEKCKVRAAIKRASETEEERAARLARDRARIYSARYTLKKKARAVNLQYVLNQTLSNCSDMTNPPDMSKKEKAAYKAYLLLQTQRAAAARSAADRRKRETFEQRTARLEKCRLRSAVSRANEDEETRAVRLARQRLRTNSARLKQRLIEVDSQQADRQCTKTNNIYCNRGKTLLQSFKNNSYPNHSEVFLKEFRKKLFNHQYHQLHLAYNFNTHLCLQGAANQSQLANNPSNFWPRFDHLGLFFGNSKVQPQIPPDIKEGEIMDETSDLEYDSSKSDLVFECEVTIEEESNSIINQECIQKAPTEDVNSLFDSKPNILKNEMMAYGISERTFMDGGDKEEPLFETVICGSTTVKQEPLDTMENVSGDSLALGKVEQFDSLPAEIS